MENAAINTLIVTSISAILFIVPVFVQFKIYDDTEKKAYLFIIPAVFSTASIITLILGDWAYPLFFGVPLIIGGIVGGRFAVKYNRR